MKDEQLPKKKIIQNSAPLNSHPEIIQKEWQVPVCKPKLPDWNSLKKYVERIDEARWYSNYGPLQRELISRLARHFDSTSTRICLTSSGTMGLVAALSVLAKQKGQCLMPAWTFVASAQAALWAGLTPEFMDVDLRDGVLDPAAVRERITRSPEDVAAVMVVSPFGQPLDPEPWRRLWADTGIPVVLDAAAGFDGLVDGGLPAVVSLHATKVLPSAEGGVVLMPNEGLAEQAVRATNFGFFGTREATRVGQNGRMSEYHAAIALAGLDEWPARRDDFRRVALAYRRELDGVPYVQLASGFGSDWISATAVARVNSKKILKAEDYLRLNSIETRRWWDMGCHHQPIFESYAHKETRNTDILASESLGLPMSCDLSDDLVKYICTLVRGACSEL